LAELGQIDICSAFAKLTITRKASIEAPSVICAFIMIILYYLKVTKIYKYNPQ